ncbi:WYL domain-containing protein [Niabella sp. CC-SYL272]|uniref:helix-turn-helix transcriptional regulator n=1 Tax=Niabella agricola TaxID=2891571 RepID=UPI001F4355E7|nr:WYL domain-containing protein [Niabella agricola]MCF3112219.1 WYL domain-containing protein [Niabella agricola]
MPVNRNALIRYRTIDRCLQNRRRKWTIEDLIDACNDALYEYEDIEKGVSLRTIRMDLNAMRSDKLGYNAPIIVTDRKYYTYEDPAYSISKIPLSHQDLDVLQDVSFLLQQFKGFSHFNDLDELLQRLEDKIYTERGQESPVIDFEKNDLLAGIHWLDPLHKAIIKKRSLQVTYQSFSARQPADMVVYPYLLKEFRNRWFLLCMHRKGKVLLTLALDRIAAIKELPGEAYLVHKGFNAATYFSDIIGVTKNVADQPTRITFMANAKHAPYIRTKPIHASQQIVSTANGWTTFTIEVIPNFELERELLGFGEGLRVTAPASVVRIFKQRIRKMQEFYTIGQD